MLLVRVLALVALERRRGEYRSSFVLIFIVVMFPSYPILTEYDRTYRDGKR